MVRSDRSTSHAYVPMPVLPLQQVMKRNVGPMMLAACMVMVLARPAQAQRPANLPLNITTSASPLSPEQSNQVRAYAAYYTAILKNPSSKPEEVEQARAALVEPVSRPNTSRLFRLELGNAAISELELAITDSTIHAGVNALIVASFIGERPSINLLTRHADRETQPKWQLRLQAAFGCVTLLRGDTLEARQVLQQVQSLKYAATQEDHALILRHQLTAIDAADHNPYSTEERKQLRVHCVDTIIEVANKVAGDPKRQTEPILASITDAMNLVRRKYLDGTMDALEQRAVGPKIATAIGQTLVIAQKNWAQGQGEARSKRGYSVMIGAWEGFLSQVDKSVRGGTPELQTKLRSTWDAGDKAAFDAEVTKWTTVLGLPPYAK